MNDDHEDSWTDIDKSEHNLEMAVKYLPWIMGILLLIFMYIFAHQYGLFT